MLAPIRKDADKIRYGTPLKVFDFKKGLCTVKPAVLLNLGFSPFLQNVWYDEENALTKIPGTSSLLTAANNAFATNPIYGSYNFITSSGKERLIIQGIDASVGDMRLYSYTAEDSAVTAIKTGLTLNRVCDYVTYRGYLYVTNGNDPLQRWVTGTEWKQYHTNFSERFKYLATHYHRLWAACSGQNPSRAIYSGVNNCYFPEYYDERTPSNYIDFPTDDGAPITDIIEHKDTLLVFKLNHIYAVFGDPSILSSLNVTKISDGIGTIARTTIQKLNDVVIFAWWDGIYVLGDRDLFISEEDRQVQSKTRAVRITKEIDNFWKEHIVIPDSVKTVEKIWAGSDFSGWSLTNCQYNADLVDIGNQGVINGVLTGTSTLANSAIALGSWVDLDLSNYKNEWYAQCFKMPGENSTCPAIPDKVLLWLKKTGTLTSTMKLNVSICANNDLVKDGSPDFDKVYASGQLSLDNVTSTTGAEYTVNMSYWDHPQNLYDGDATSLSLLWIVVRVTNITSGNYPSWSYTTNGNADKRMKNYDENTPPNQERCSYYFKMYCRNFHSGPATVVAKVYTESYDASSDENFDHWGTIMVINDESTIGDYERNSEMILLLYATSTNGSSWSSWIDIENGGAISENNTQPYIKFLLGYKNPIEFKPWNNDSFTLLKIQFSYSRQLQSEQLLSSAIYDNRYWLAVKQKQWAVSFS